MNKKKLGILLLFTPLFTIIIVFIMSILVKRDFPILDSILEYCFYYVSPVLFGIGLYLSIKNRDTNKSFISNKVSKKRMIIGKIILFGMICPLFLFLIGAFLYISLVENIEERVKKQYQEQYNSNYLKKCQRDPISQSEQKEELLEPTLIGNYEFVPDEYTWYFDVDDYGYYELEPHIHIPKYYVPKQIYSLEKSWILKNNYKLELKCNPIDFRSIDINESNKCSIYYNNKLVSKEVRHDAFCFWDSNKSCTDNLGIVLYSNRYSAGSVEYLFLVSKDGEIHNKLSAFKLENGDVTLLPFKYEYKGQSYSDDSYTISGVDFDLFGVTKYGMFDTMMDGNEELVTFFYEPTMGVNNNIDGIYSLWNLQEDGYHLKKTVIELIPDWETEIEDF